MLRKIIENPNVQRKVNSTLSRGGRGNNTFMQKIIRILFGLLGLAGAFEQKPAVLNYHLYNSDLSVKRESVQKTKVFRSRCFKAILGLKSTRKPISKIKARLMVCSQVFLHDETAGFCSNAPAGPSCVALKLRPRPLSPWFIVQEFSFFRCPELPVIPG